MDGRYVEVETDSICLHSGSTGAVEIAQQLRAAIASESISVEPLSEIVGSG